MIREITKKTVWGILLGSLLLSLISCGEGPTRDLGRNFNLADAELDRTSGASNVEVPTDPSDLDDFETGVIPTEITGAGLAVPLDDYIGCQATEKEGVRCQFEKDIDFEEFAGLSQWIGKGEPVPVLLELDASDIREPDGEKDAFALQSTADGVKAWLLLPQEWEPGGAVAVRLVDPIPAGWFEDGEILDLKVSTWDTFLANGPTGEPQPQPSGGGESPTTEPGGTTEATSTTSPETSPPPTGADPDPSTSPAPSPTTGADPDPSTSPAPSPATGADPDPSTSPDMGVY